MPDTPPSGATTASSSPHFRSAVDVPPLRHVDAPRVEQPHGTRRAVRSILSLLGGAVGALIAAAGIRLFGSSAVSDTGLQYGGRGALIAWIGLLVVIALVVIAIHEGGHALGGHLGGLRLIAFVVGPLQIVRADGGLRMGFNRYLARAGGLVLCVPTRWTGDRAFRRAFRWCVAAGPLASLIIGIAALIVSRNMTPVPPWTSALFTGGLMSLAIGVGTLIPLRMSGGFVSDGGQLLRFRESKARTGSALSSLAPVTAITLFAQTERPRDWNSELVQEVRAVTEHDAYAVTALSFIYYRALDTGDVAGAREALQSAIDRGAALRSPAGERTRRVLSVEAAVFEGVWRRDPEAARSWLDAADRGRSLDPHGTLLATSAIEARDGSRTAAQRSLNQAAAIAQRNLFPGIALCRLATVERLVRDLA